MISAPNRAYRHVGLALALFTLFSVGPLTSAAYAKKRVVVLSFSGPGGARVRAAVIRKIKRRVRVVSSRAYRSAARNLGVDGSQGAGMRAVCSKLRISAVIKGSVKRDRRRRRRVRATVTVYNGATGRVIGSRTLKSRGGRRLVRTGGKLGRKSLRFVRRGSYRRGRRRVAPTPATPVAPVDENPPGIGGAAADSKDPPKAADDDDGDGDSDLDGLMGTKADPVDADDDTSSGGHDGLVAVQLAFGLASRSYTLTASDPNQNRKYSGALYPEMTLALETYPLLLMNRGFLSGLGLGLSYTRHLSISTKQKGTDASVDSSSTELLVNLRYRWLIQDKVAGPTVFGFFGYGARSFELADNPTLPSFNYQFLHIAVGGRIPILGDILAAELQASIRPILKVGQAAVDALGKKSGGFGWSVRAGLTGQIAFGLFYVASAELIGLSTDFEGLSTRVADVDLDVASSGSDSFIRFWLGVGYAL